MVALGLGAAAPAQADTTLTSCLPSDWAAAVAAGGTVHFGVDCPSLVPAATTGGPAGKTLDVEADGHLVFLSGAGKRRLFTVHGGQLTVRGITIQNGAFTAATGASGAQGTPGTNGIAGDHGTGGGIGQAGTNGLAGTAGQPGGAAGAGGAGKAAQGGAVYVGSGTAVFDHVTFSSNTDTGGDGGSGGGGGRGGSGGAGGGGGGGGAGESPRGGGVPRRCP